jgi:hypothetical protein
VEVVMAKPRKAPISKQRPARVSRKMASVRPMKEKAAIGRPSDLGFKPPPHPNAEAGEGEPEVNG